MSKYNLIKDAVSKFDLEDWKMRRSDPYEKGFDDGYYLALAGAFNLADGYFTAHGNYACYASIQQTAYNKDYLVFAIREPNVEWLKYVMEESVFAPFFISNAEQTIEDKQFYMRTDGPANVTIGAAMVVRMMWEYPEKVAFFNKLLEKGLSKDDAFILCHLFTPYGETISAELPAHSAFNSFMCFRTIGLKNFYKRNIILHRGSLKDGDDYLGVSQMFSEPKYIDWYVWGNNNGEGHNIYLHYKEMVEKSNVLNTELSVNPFSKDKGYKTDLDELIRLVNLDQYK